MLEDRRLLSIFASVITFPSGGVSPETMSVGDFNGDGKSDLAVSNGASASVGVFLGNGNGGFTLSGTVSSGGIIPISVKVSDFNGDGKSDLAVGNFSSGTVGILLGNGSGGFALVGTFSSGDTGGSPYSVSVGDFNGDGKKDIAVANYYNGTVGILIGNGSGGFTLAGMVSSGGSRPRSVLVADCNGDGKSDLIVANETSGTVGVLLGNGDGGFALVGTFSSGNGYSMSVAVGDFNGDGKSDLAVANFNSGMVGILLGNGSGGFTLASTAFSGGGEPMSVSVGDFNGDGISDLAVTNYFSNMVGVLLGNGYGCFSLAGTFSSGDDSPNSVTVGDFNSDGKSDLAVTNYNSNSVGILLNIYEPPHGLAIITHGFMLTGTRDPWLDNMADQIIVNAGGGNRIDLNFDTAQITNGGVPTLIPGGETVVVYDWASKSNNTVVTSGEAEPGWREAAGDLLANWLLSTGLVQAANTINIPIHFIAHSYGTVVISEAIRRLGFYGIEVDQMTTLDPHDQDQVGIPDASNDPQVTVWSNIAFADNYWEDNAGASNNPSDNNLPWIDLPVGHPITAAANRDLTLETAFNGGIEMAYAPHSRIHSWYYKTINGNEEPDGYPEIAGRDWYPNVDILQHGFALTNPTSRTNYSQLEMTAPSGSKPNPLLTQSETVLNGDFRFWSYDSITYDLPGYDDGDNSWTVDTGDIQYGHAAELSFTDQSFKHRPVWLPARATTLQFDYNVQSGGSGDLLRFWFDGMAAPSYIRDISADVPGWHTAIVAIPPSLRGTATAFTIEARDPSLFFPMNSDVWIDNIVVIPPGPATWDGGGADNNWTTGVNWVGDIAPLFGDNLVFPGGAARPDNVNNFASGTRFGSIVVSGGYHIQNNAIQSTTVEVQGNAVFTADSLVCDTLTIGSATTAAVSANPVVPLTANIAQSVVSDLPANAAKASTAIDSMAIMEQPIAEKVILVTTPATFLVSVQSAAEVPQLSHAALPPVIQAISTPKIVLATRLPEQTDWQNNEALLVQPLHQEPFAGVFNAAAFMATRFDIQSEHAFSILSPITNRLEDSVYGELTDYLARAKKQSSAVLTGSQNARNLALQSIVKEFQQAFTAEQDDFDLLAGKHFRKQDKLAKKAIDDFHSHLVGGIDR